MQKMLLANWKMNGTRADWRSWTRTINAGVEKGRLEVIIAPPTIGLVDVSEHMGKLSICGQDCSNQQSGAYTGQVSPSMLKEFNCKYVMLGHSETREFMGVTNEQIAQKAAAAEKAGLIPIICIGESYNEFNAGKTIQSLDEQLLNSINDLFVPTSDSLVIAYEPRWMISTSGQALLGDKKEFPKEKLTEVFRYLRQALVQNYNDLGYDIKLLYGGSVSPSNVKEILSIPEVGGVLVGGASLKPETLINISQNMTGGE